MTTQKTIAAKSLLKCVMCLVLLCCYSVVQTGAKESEPKTLRQNVESRVASALEVVASKDAGALATLASGDEDEVWLIVEEMLIQGHGDAALAVAHATKGGSESRIASYVARRVVTEHDVNLRTAYWDAVDAHEMRDSAKAASILEAWVDPSETVLWNRICSLWGAIHRRLRDPKASYERYMEAGETGRVDRVDNSCVVGIRASSA